MVIIITMMEGEIRGVVTEMMVGVIAMTVGGVIIIIFIGVVGIIITVIILTERVNVCIIGIIAFWKIFSKLVARQHGILLLFRQAYTLISRNSF